MSDQAYEEVKLYDEDGREIISQERMTEIDAWFDEAAVWSRRLEPIRPVLERMRKGGHYRGVGTDPLAGLVVFVQQDGTRFTRTPEQLALLFGLDKTRDDARALGPTG